MKEHEQAHSDTTVQRATRAERWLAGAISGIIGGGIVTVYLLQRVGFNFGAVLGQCGFRARTGLPCITCGMTRSVVAFCRGDLIESFSMQPAGGFLCCVVLVIGLLALFVALTGIMPLFIRRYWAEFRVGRFLLQLAVILLAGWIVTFAQAWSHLH